MRNGFTKTTLGVLSAALLSGTVFAAGPTVTQPPSVIITDKHQAADVLILSGTNQEYDFLTDATENRFRFTNAFKLTDYVSHPTIANAKYLFTEKAVDGSGNPTGGILTGGSRTIKIDGSLGFAAAPTWADVTGSGAAVQKTVPYAGLDFINSFRSPDPDNPTDFNQNPTFNDSAYITLYVGATDDGTNTVNSTKSFYVYTTNDPTNTGDRFSAPTSIFTRETCYNDFNGWVYIDRATQYGNLYAIAGNATAVSAFAVNTKPAAVSPAVTAFTAVAASTPKLSIATDGTLGGTFVSSPTPGAKPTGASDLYAFMTPQYAAWGTWSRIIGVASGTPLNAAADKLYMARWTFNGTGGPATQADSPKLPLVRIRIGAADAFGNGVQYDGFPTNGLNTIVGNRVHRSYYYSHSASKIGFAYDLVDYWDPGNTAVYPNGNINYTLELSKLEVFSFDRSQLTGATVLLNQGDTSTFATSDSTTPPSGAVAFQSPAATPAVTLPAAGTIWWGRVSRENFTTGTRGFAVSGNGSKLSMTAATGMEGALLSWDTYGTLLGNTAIGAAPQEIIQGVANNKLVFMDAWMSTTAGANHAIGNLRIGMNSDIYNGTTALSASQGRFVYHLAYATNRTLAGTDFNDGQPITSGMALSAVPRRWTIAYEPQLVAASTTTLSLRPAIDLYSYPVVLPASDNRPVWNPYYDAGTVDIHRVVITTYDPPSDLTSVGSDCP